MPTKMAVDDTESDIICLYQSVSIVYRVALDSQPAAADAQEEAIHAS